MTQVTKIQERSIITKINKRHYMYAFTINPYDAGVPYRENASYSSARLCLPN